MLSQCYSIHLIIDYRSISILLPTCIKMAFSSLFFNLHQYFWGSTSFMDAHGLYQRGFRFGSLSFQTL